MDQGYNFANIEAGFKIYISSGNKSLGTNTVKNYISDLRYFLGWYHQTYKSAASLDAPASSVAYFDHIDTNSIKQYIDYLNMNNTSSKTVKRRISSLSGFLKYLVSNDLIADNYLKTLKKAEKEVLNPQARKAQENATETIAEVILSEQDKTVIHSQNPPPNHEKKSRSWSFALIAIMAITSIIFNTPAFKAANSQPSNIPFLSQVGKGGTRVLTFRGRLTDSLGNPINQKTDVRFKLYKSPTANSTLFESNACTVYPDVEGNFEVAIGSSERNINTIGCDKKIPSDLFSAASPLYLGVTVGTNAEMKPRQQIANVGLADSAMKINGMALGSGTNNIPYINSRGEISLKSESPDINATSVSDDFKITSSRSLLLQTGADGDLNLSATESGRIRFLTGGSETERMVIAQNGNVGVGTANPAYFRLEVSGSVGPSITKTYNLGAANRLWNTLYVNRICFDENERYCTTGLEPTSVAKISTSVASGSSQLTGDLLLGGTATASANIKLSGTTGNPSFIRTGYLGINTAAPSSALDVVGSASFGGNTIDITTHADEDLTLVANGSGVINLDDETNVGRNFAAGTTVTSGTTKLDIGGTATANALCHQTQSGTDNEAIVDCSSTPTADFAEMYPVQEGADYGEIMSLSSQEVQTTDGQYIRKLIPAVTVGDKHLLGVISDNYGDFISVGHNLKKEDNPRPIALKGRVPVKIASSSDDIKAGDYLTSSKEPGRASKAVRAGVVIGKALEDWSPLSGKNQIMVFVGTEYADPGSTPIDLVENLQKSIGLLTSPIIANQKIISPVIQTDSVITRDLAVNTIKPKEKDITIDLGTEASGAAAKLSVLGNTGTEVAAIDNQGNASFSGSLAARDASVSGTLTATNIESDNIKDLERRLSSAVEKSTYNQDINSIQSALGEIKNNKIPDPSLYPPAPSGVVADESMSSLLDSLIVTGDTNLFKLQVHEELYSLKDELKISALASINFLDGAIVMTRDGNITARGTITAREVKAQKFSILNDQSRETASIDASGAAQFASLTLPSDANSGTPSAIIAAEKNFKDNGVFMPALESKRDSAGVGVIPLDQPEVAIYNEGLKSGSLIFLTAQDSTTSAALSVAKKVTCEAQTPCKPYFTVSTGTNSHQDIYFNWLILNNR